MQDFTVQMILLVAMITKISVATITGNDCFSKKVSSYQNWSFYASKQLRYQQPILLLWLPKTPEQSLKELTVWVKMHLHTQL